MDLLLDLARSLPYALGAILLLIALALLALWLVVRRARLGTGDGGGGQLSWLQKVASDVRAWPSSSGLRRSFAEAMRRLERALPGLGSRYRLPWYLMIGESRSGKTTLLDRAGLQPPFGEPAQPPAGGQPACGWWFFRQAVVLDLVGDLVLRSDGRTSDEDTWRTVLRLIERDRPRRPLDGAVLTIPARVLGGLDGQGADLLDDAAQRAAVLYRKLWECQSALGIRLPLYVVVTQSDLLPGFSAFSGALPAEARGQMFGASIAGSPETAYSSSWVDRLFQDIGSSLNQALAEVLGGRRSTGGADDVVLVARSVAAVREPVRVYLNQIFSPSAYHEGFALRGLYFTAGELGPGGTALAAWDTAPGPTPGSQGDAPPHAVFFAHDLLAEKIFPEAPVGRPTRAAGQSRRRTRLLLAAALGAVLLFGVLGMPAGFRAASQTAGELKKPFLDQTLRDLKMLGPAGGMPAKPGRFDPREPMLRRLVREAGQQKDYTLRTVLLPASWTSRLDRDFRGSVVKAYDRIALPALVSSLGGKLTALSQVGGPPPHDFDPTPTYYDKTAELQRWETFLADLQKIEPRVTSYNCLAGTCASDRRLLADLTDLLLFCYDEKLTFPSQSATRFYEKVAQRVSAPAIAYPPAGTDFRLQEGTRTLAGDFYARLFGYNALRGDLNALSLELLRLGDTRTSIGGDVQKYKKLLELIDKTQQDLGRPEIAWIAPQTFAPGPAYDQALAAVKASAFLGPQLAADLRKQGSEGFRDLKVKLANWATPYTGPLLAQKDGQVLLQLSPEVLQLQKALQGLLGQGFMEPGATQEIVSPPPAGTVLFWSANLLQQAQGEVNPYQDFLATGLALFPAQLQDQVARVGRVNLRDEMMDTIAGAQSFQPRAPAVPELMQKSLDAQVQSFQTASPLLSSLEASLTGLGFPGDAGTLDDAVDTQRRDLLEQADALLTRANLYSPEDKHFSAWNGKPVLAFQAFNVADAGGLASYLDAQRQIVTTLARSYASPALGGSGPTAALSGAPAGRWRTILSDLDAYQAKKAGNPLQSLEDLIAKTMQEVTLANCFTLITPAQLQASSSDDFLAKQYDLTRGIYGRCRTLAEREGSLAYDRLAAIFNQRLAGRFPFSRQDPGHRDVQAPPAGIAEFYAAFDPWQDVIASIPEGAPVFAGQEAEVRAFMKQMRLVRPLFAPFLDTPQQYPSPTLGLAVEFRVNRRVNRPAEGGDNEIFIWQLDVGDASYQLGGKQLTGQWVYGQPVVLTLAWATDSPDVPVSAMASEWVAVEGRTVRWDYNSPWGLFALIRDNLPDPGEVPAGQEPKVLELQVLTQPETAQGTVSTSRTKAFVRVTLLTPDQKTVLDLPELPDRAPMLELAGRSKPVP